MEEDVQFILHYIKKKEKKEREEEEQHRLIAKIRREEQIRLRIREEEEGNM